MENDLLTNYIKFWIDDEILYKPKSIRKTSDKIGFTQLKVIKCIYKLKWINIKSVLMKFFHNPGVSFNITVLMAREIIPLHSKPKFEHQDEEFSVKNRSN